MKASQVCGCTRPRTRAQTCSARSQSARNSSSSSPASSSMLTGSGQHVQDVAGRLAGALPAGKIHDLVADHPAQPAAEGARVVPPVHPAGQPDDQLVQHARSDLLGIVRLQPAAPAENARPVAYDEGPPRLLVAALGQVGQQLRGRQFSGAGGFAHRLPAFAAPW